MSKSKYPLKSTLRRFKRYTPWWNRNHSDERVCCYCTEEGCWCSNKITFGLILAAISLSGAILGLYFLIHWLNRDN